jgi:hypothetical protein
MAYLGRKSATATLTSADIADSTILIQDLADEVGIESTHHKVPAHANDSARDSAIGSPANGMLIYNTNSGAVQQYNGVWSTIAPAPNISAVSGFLNDDSDSTLTLFGSNFSASSAVKMFSASSGGSQIGSNATTTFNSSSKLTAVFGAGSIGASGSTAYIEVDNVGATNRFATAITVNADPTVTNLLATGTGAINHPTASSHLGTYGGATAGGPTESNTKLLLNFDRGGGTDFEDSSNTGGDGHKVTVVADAKIKASPFGDGKTAMKFDGTDDYLTCAASSDFDFSSSDWTYEFWINPSAAALSLLFSFFTDSSNNIALYTGSNLILVFEDKQGGSHSGRQLSSGQPLTLNVWSHVAYVRDHSASTMALYIDGNHITTGSFSTMTNNSGRTLQIGTQDSGANYDYSGYLDQIRLVVGTKVYTGNFTVPTTRFSGSGQSAGASGSNITAVTAAQTKLLIHSNLSSTSTTFTDSATTGTTHTVTASGNTKHSTLYNHAESTVVTPAMTWPASGKAFGSTGAYFDGTGDYLSIPDSADWDIGTGDFTVDFWAYSTIAPSAAKAWFALGTGSIGSYGTDAMYFRVQSSTQLNFSINENATNVTLLVDHVATQNTWFHYAVVRSSGTVTIYANGSSVGTTGTMTASISAPTHMIIGARNGGTAQIWTGYIDAFRVSKGIARWTSAFTPPTSAYGASLSQTIPTITFTGTATQLAGDEDIEFTSVANTTKAANNQHLTDSGIGLTLTNLTGGDKNKATLTGTIASSAGTTHTNMPMKVQVRKTLATAAYADASRVVTFSGSETTAGLAPAMPVSGTGIPASTTITTVDTATTITLSANPTGGTLTGQSLVFSDLTRVAHVNGAEVLATGDSMLTIATGTGGADPVLFNARRYMGNTTGLRQITGFGFQPDLVWIKDRDTAGSHGIFDIVRGTNDSLFSNSSGAEDTGANYLSAFGSDGFTLGQSGTGNSNVANNLNGDNSAFIAWAWKAGGAPTGNGKRRTNDSATETTLSASGSPGTDSTLYTTGFQFVKQSVNSAGQFSITQYQSQNPVSGNYLLPHGLTGAPDFIIIKSSSNANSWHVWHDDVTTPATGYLTLDYPDAEANSASPFGNTAPSATHITLGGSGNVNYDNRTYIMYAWKAVAGVSHFGTYEGLGSAATNVVVNDMGFEPKWLLIKNIDAGSSSWLILDGFRDVGEMITGLIPNTNAADDSTTTFGTTATSTGFTMDSGTTSAYLNSSGHTFIYAAFA